MTERKETTRDAPESPETSQDPPDVSAEDAGESPESPRDSAKAGLFSLFVQQGSFFSHAGGSKLHKPKKWRARQFRPTLMCENSHNMFANVFFFQHVLYNPSFP